ncbi:hypothetical protein MNQ95_08365 [Pseudoxanthomonas daejeonensis]|uniref:hypothetical protein n=1 Tax=Pseudoxanthomonas daejeonensis TaxID=266062 RepID=UPI001F545F24|nr:hypothetical protein [Pseudoxanthomonas daejeonensis]UNK56191.1 hypothetical protein MNQ95_08365 [Pseudoxanthomonas daejeonensis]
MSGKMLLGAIAALMLSSCATTYSITPVDTGAAMVTYGNGLPTTDLERANGAVQVTPLGVASNGRLTFAVAGYNKLVVPSDFGPEHFAARAGVAELRLYTYDQLEQEAQSAAAWAAFAVALTGAAAVYAANDQAWQTTDTTLYTPDGAYTVSTTTYDPALAAAGTAAATAATMAGIDFVGQQLDAARARLGDTILQSTTLDPQQAYGGYIVVARPKVRPPYVVEVSARWNNEDYRFRFNVAKVE